MTKRLYCSRQAIPVSVIDEADLTCIGAFYMPDTLGDGSVTSQGGSEIDAFGLTLRYVSGVLHLLATAPGNTSNGEVYEVSVPTLVLPGGGSYNTATELKHYTDVYGSYRIVSDNPPLTNAIYWDETDRFLYWAFGSNYSTSDDERSFGRTSLNYAAGTASAAGSWKFSGLGWKAAQSAVTGLPVSFRTAYAGSKRIAIGGGGYFSIVGQGSVSMGPALTAIDPASLGASGSAVAHTPLVGYWPYSDAPVSVARMNRPTSSPALVQSFDACDNSVVTWTDWFRGGSVVIDTGTKQGAIFMGNFGHGISVYGNSTLNTEGADHWFFVYDLRDLGRVFAGAVAKDSIQPTHRWQVVFPDIDYTFYPNGPQTIHSVSSLTRSGTTATLVSASHGWSTTPFPIRVSGANQSGYNNAFYADVVNANTLSFTVPNTLATPATGTITVSRMVADAPGDKLIKGIAFDTITNRLYILVKTGSYPSEKTTVYVYQLS